MKKIISLVAVFSVVAISSTAIAQPSPYDLKGKYPKQTGIYVAAKVSYGIQDISADRSDDDSVMAGGVAVGYNFYNRDSKFPMRIEGEYMMRESADVRFGSTDYSYGVDTLMLNGAIGINTGTKLTPYLTAGIGYSTIEGKNGLGGDNNDFAWTVGADVTYSINENILLGLEFRHIEFGEADLRIGGTKPDLSAQELMLAFRYKF